MWEETSNRGFLHNETKAALMSSPNAVTAVESIALWERERQALKELHTLFLKPEGDLNDVCNLTLCVKQTIGFSWLDPLCLPAIISQTEIRRYTWLIFLEPSSQPRMLSSLTPSQLTSPWKKKKKKQDSGIHGKTDQILVLFAPLPPSLGTRSLFSFQANLFSFQVFLSHQLSTLLKCGTPCHRVFQRWT